MLANRSAALTLGVGVTVGLVVLGLWGWEAAETIVGRLGWSNRSVGSWAVRCAAIGAVAAGQAVLIALIVERAYRRDRVCGFAKLSALFVFMVCAVSAIALAFAGR